MSKYLIDRNTKPKPFTKYRVRKDDFSDGLNIMEFFCDTIQGEGLTIGQPAVFLRLQGCTLDCVWCDTEWRLGSRFVFEQIWELMEKPRFNVIEKFAKGHNLILTGGSPLKQQHSLMDFIDAFDRRYNFRPTIEIENECVLMPDEEFVQYVDVWTNSPKLSSSGMKRQVRYKPVVLQTMSEITDRQVCYKFVVGCVEDWQEIQMDFIDPGYVKTCDIILMPLAATLAELEKNRPFVLDLALQHGVRYSTREQLVLGLP